MYVGCLAASAGQVTETSGAAWPTSGCKSSRIMASATWRAPLASSGEVCWSKRCNFQQPSSQIAFGSASSWSFGEHLKQLLVCFFFSVFGFPVAYDSQGLEHQHS